jgi:hypothetical protein
MSDISVIANLNISPKKITLLLTVELAVDAKSNPQKQHP